MQNEQRITFYRYAAAIRRRRRRTISIYLPEDDYERRKGTTLQIDQTRSYEDFYKEYNNIQITDNGEMKISEETRNFARKIISDLLRSRNNKYNKVVMSSNKGIAYEDDNGNMYIKKGGSPAWRHNNPGNLSFKSLESAKESGAIDIVEDRDEYGKIVHRWGVFPTPEVGETALRNKLREKRFSYNPDTGQKRSISQMISEVYAPSKDKNDPVGYAKFVKDMSGIDVYNKSVSDLSKEEFDALVEAIKAREGTVQGEIIPVNQE